MKRHAFTLIELLVVIAIIGILAAFLMPALNKAMNSSRVAAANSTLKGIATACLAYQDDNGQLPADQCVNYDAVNEPATAGMTWLRQLTTQGKNFPYYAPAAKYTINSGTDDVLLVDPWRLPYVYVLAPQRRGLGNTFKNFPGNVGGINVFSLGPNKVCNSCGNFLSTGSNDHDTTAAVTVTLSQKHIGGASPTTGDDPRNW